MLQVGPWPHTPLHGPTSCAELQQSRSRSRISSSDDWLCLVLPGSPGHRKRPFLANLKSPTSNSCRTDSSEIVSRPRLSVVTSGDSSACNKVVSWPARSSQEGGALYRWRGHSSARSGACFQRSRIHDLCNHSMGGSYRKAKEVAEGRNYKKRMGKMTRRKN